MYIHVHNVHKNPNYSYTALCSGSALGQLSSDDVIVSQLHGAFGPKEKLCKAFFIYNTKWNITIPWPGQEPRFCVSVVSWREVGTLATFWGKSLVFLKNVSQDHRLQCQHHTTLCVASLEETSNTEHRFALLWALLCSALAPVVSAHTHTHRTV